MRGTVLLDTGLQRETRKPCRCAANRRCKYANIRTRLPDAHKQATARYHQAVILLIVYIELSRFAASGYWRRLPASAVVFAIALSGLPLSPFVRKTLFMLYELDLSFEQKMPPVFDHLESQLDASGAGWLIGEDFTYADIAIGAHMSNLVLAQIEPDRRRWSTLGAWFERVQSRSAFQQLCTDARNFRP